MDSWRHCRAHAVDAADAWRALAKLKARLGMKAAAEGPRIGRYELLDRIGRGGFGQVYRGRDPDLDRPVAIKAVTLPATDERETEALVRREARALARLSHPNVVNVYDVSRRPALRVPGPEGTSGAGPVREDLCIVMEYIDGQTVDDWIADRSPTPEEILDVYLEAGDGLAAAHHAEVLHLDFKPSNVMRARDGRVVVLDFGLATLLQDLEDAEAATASQLVSAHAESATRLGGTPQFMPPEQFRGRPAGPTADVYAFACALYGSLLGAPVFVGSSMSALHEAKLAGPPPPSGRVEPRVAAVLRKALAPEPSDRWPSMDAMLEALHRARRARRARVRWILGGVAAAAVAAGVALELSGSVASPTQLCEREALRLREGWSEQREPVEHALLTAGVTPLAAQVTVERIDDHVGDWVADYRATCASGDTMAERARACLEHSGRALSSRIASIVRTPRRARGGTFLLEGLRSGAECESDELSRRQPLPSDIDALRAISELAEWVNEHTSEEAELDVADEHVATARALGHLPTLAEVELHAGFIASGLAAHQQRAQRYFQAAFDDAIAGGADRVAIAASVSIVGLDPSILPLSEARHWIGTALALCDRLENTDRRRVQAHLNLSQALAHEGHYQEAREVVGSELDWAYSAPLDEKIATHLLHAAGVLAIYLDDDAAAIEPLEAALVRAEWAVADDPFSVEIAVALASAYRHVERYGEAEDRLWSLLDRPGLSRSQWVRIWLALIIVVANKPSRVPEALVLVEVLARDIARQEGTSASIYADALATKGHVLGDLGLYEEALGAYQAARSIYLTHEATGSPRLHNVERGMAEVDARRRDNPSSSPDTPLP